MDPSCDASELIEIRDSIREGNGVHRGAREGDVGSVLSKAVAQKIIGRHHNSEGGGNKCALFYDADAFHETLIAAKTAFPPHFLHAMAVKSNPVATFLRTACAVHGMGLECASYSEVLLAHRVGCQPHKIVYDSPCKTHDELRGALKLGVLLNIDNFSELDRVIEIVEGEMGGKLASEDACVGVRINPLLGSGSIEALSVSNARSKFGIPLPDAATRERLILAFCKHKWLKGLHVHVGSQGCGMVMLAAGASYVCALADEIDERCGGKRISTIDIGGGLPSNYSSESMGDFTFSGYVDALQKDCPAILNTTDRRVVTEFGRAIVSKLGWIATEIEYVKDMHLPNASAEDLPRKTLITHAGADLFLRTCYCPENFPVRLRAYVRRGEYVSDAASADVAKSDALYDIAGPLCFGGDKIGKGVQLPLALSEGDFIVALDSGANCLSLWSHHCSRVPPPVYAYSRSDDGDVKLSLVRSMKNAQEKTLDFWF